MDISAGTTTGRIIDAARRRVVQQGYSGFSFADVSEDVGIRKPSIHHHFATKADLVVAVLDRSRATIEAQATTLDRSSDAAAILGDYAEQWRRCIAADSEPFCIAGVLAAEMPNLPAAVATAVEAHFTALERWITAVLAMAREQGCAGSHETPECDAQHFIATVYGAMLAARVHGEPARFARIVARSLNDFIRPDAAPR